MTNPAFYGGGHSMKLASDFVFWCQRSCTNYSTPSDVFIPPKLTIGNVVQPYARIASCLEMTGVTVPYDYRDLYAWLFQEQALVSLEEALRTRGAILLNQGTVSCSVGDGRRIIMEKDYLLTSAYIGSKDPLSLFEYGALVPGLDYL